MAQVEWNSYDYGYRWGENWSHSWAKRGLFQRIKMPQPRAAVSISMQGDRSKVFLKSEWRQKMIDRRTQLGIISNANWVLNLIDGDTIWVRSSEDQFKIHYQMVKKRKGDWLLCPYASMSSTWRVCNSSFKIGLRGQWKEGVFLQGRYRSNVGQFRNQRFLYGKAEYVGKNWECFGLGVWDVGRNYLQKSDIGLRFGVENHQIQFRVQGEDYRDYRIDYSRINNYVDLIKSSYWGQFGKTGAGLQGQFLFLDRRWNKVCLSVVHELNRYKLGGKVSMSGQVWLWLKSRHDIFSGLVGLYSNNISKGILPVPCFELGINI